MLGSGAGGTTSLTQNVMLGARDCHSTRRRSAGNAGRVPRRTCAQCGGVWGTRLDAQVSPGANLEGAVLEVSPGQEGWRGPGKRAAIALKSGRIAPSTNSRRASKYFRILRPRYNCGRNIYYYRRKIRRKIEFDGLFELKLKQAVF